MARGHLAPSPHLGSVHRISALPLLSVNVVTVGPELTVGVREEGQERPPHPLRPRGGRGFTPTGPAFGSGLFPS